MTTINMSMSELTEDLKINIKVTGLTRWKLRWWIAEKLLVFAAWVAGCGLRVDIES